MPQTAEAAKKFNRQLRETAATLGGQGAARHEYGFACECGCGGTARLTLGQYDHQGGAWSPGHKPA